MRATSERSILSAACDYVGWAVVRRLPSGAAGASMGRPLVTVHGVTLPAARFLQPDLGPVIQTICDGLVGALAPGWRPHRLALPRGIRYGQIYTDRRGCSLRVIADYDLLAGAVVRFDLGVSWP